MLRKTHPPMSLRAAGLALLLALLLAVGACGDADPGAAPRSLADEGEPGHTGNDRDSYPFGAACGWEFASNIDTMNVAFPDESAKYWVALVPMLPQTRLRIDGYYPDARYFSFNVYDPLLRPTDAIADAQLGPADDTGRNPFVDAAAPWGDAYTAYVDFAAKPDAPAANTIYAGEMRLGPQAVPQPLLTALIYRTYVPGAGQDFDGGVGLPLLTLETADGDIELLPTANCVEPLLPTLGDTLPSLGLNDQLENSDVIDDPFLAQPGTVPLGNPAAGPNVFYGLPSTVFNLLRGFLGLPVPAEAESALPLPAGGGFLSNIHNAYLTHLFSRSYGNVVLIRGKAPSYRDGQSALGSEQLRYWSVCQNDLPTQRYVACVADHQAHLDEQGYFTIMVSDPADRPANATAANAIDWMPWGPYVDALLIYRHMLPAADFAQAIHNVPQGTAPGDVMGAYLTGSAHCQREIVEAAGADPAAIFAACRAYTEALGG